MKKVSIIIPIYNVEEYLEECLVSIEKQDFGLQNIEVILINDGSTDRSIDIIKKYQLKHSDWHIIDRENKGLSVSRNEGIEMSNAPYIMFLDSDDYLVESAIKEMYQMAIENKSDVVIGRLNGFDSKGFYGYYSDKLINRIQNFEFEKNPKILKAMSVCGKLYKKELIENIRFIPKIKHEDNYFTLMTYTHANIISTIPKYYYYRRYREGEKTSITQNLSLETFNDLIYNFLFFFKENSKDNYIIKFSIRSFNNYVIRNLISNEKKQGRKKIQKYLNELFEYKVINFLDYYYYLFYNKSYYFLSNIYYKVRSSVKYEK